MEVSEGISAFSRVGRVREISASLIKTCMRGSGGGPRKRLIARIILVWVNSGGWVRDLGVQDYGGMGMGGVSGGGEPGSGVLGAQRPPAQLE